MLCPSRSGRRARNARSTFAWYELLAFICAVGKIKVGLDRLAVTPAEQLLQQAGTAQQKALQRLHDNYRDVSTSRRIF